MKPYGKAGKVWCGMWPCRRNHCEYHSASRARENRRAMRYEASANGPDDLPHWPWLGPPQWQGLDWEALPDWHPDSD